MKSPHFEVFLKRILYYSPTSLLALLARAFASKCIRCWTPSQNTLILLNKNPKIYESVLDKEVNIGQKAYDFPMISQVAFKESSRNLKNDLKR